jgi:hypothetical protein
MAYMLVRHKVEDYARWRSAFDMHLSAVRAAGGKNVRVFRTSGNARDVSVLVEWASVADARRFVEEQDLREAMESAGVVGQPEVLFLEEV